MKKILFTLAAILGFVSISEANGRGVAVGVGRGGGVRAARVNVNVGRGFAFRGIGFNRFNNVGFNRFNNVGFNRYNNLAFSNSYFNRSFAFGGYGGYGGSYNNFAAVSYAAPVLAYPSYSVGYAVGGCQGGGESFGAAISELREAIFALRSMLPPR